MAFSIGELARRTGVKVPTIRYYEQVGLLAEPPRTGGGQRRYGRQEAERLNFIRHARDLGFEVEAIRELLDLASQPDRSCAVVDAIAARHLEAVKQRIARLDRLRRELERMITECGHGRVGECRVVETLADHDLCAGEHGRRDESGPIAR